MTQTYRIADIVIQICSLHERVGQLCAGYRTADEPADVCVRITRADLDNERANSAREDVAEGRLPKNHTDEYLEELAVYRKIAERMPAFDTILMHGSCIAVDGKGYLFAAKSGTGKSTHTRLWREMLGDRAVMINDDKPLIRVTENGVTAFGTPWDGKHHLSTNCSVPLKGICILERAEQNAIRRIRMSEAYPFLIRQIYRPADHAMMLKTLTLANLLTKSVDLWRLGCNMEPEAAQVAYRAMSGLLQTN